MSEPIEITDAMVRAFEREVFRRSLYPRTSFETSCMVLEVAFAIHGEAVAEKQKARRHLGTAQHGGGG